MQKTDPPIIVEQTFNSSLNRVWEAITEPNQMSQWFFPQIESFKAEQGFKTEFLVEIENRKFTHLWGIMSVETKQKIEYTWRYKEYPGDSMVTFELKEEDTTVKLKLTATVLEDFPQHIPEFKRESGVEGWNYLIKESLKNYLEQGK